MRKTVYISGIRKWLIDISVFIRFCFAALTYFGFIKGVRNIYKYLADKNNLFYDLPNRYVKNDINIFAILKFLY